MDAYSTVVLHVGSSYGVREVVANGGASLRRYSAWASTRSRVRLTRSPAETSGLKSQRAVRCLSGTERAPKYDIAGELTRENPLLLMVLFSS